jgi:hypothetical protein
LDHKVSDREDFDMSQFTFNIADYRPLFAARTHKTHDFHTRANRTDGFVILASGPRGDANELPWMQVRSAVVDIRTMRGAQEPRRLLLHDFYQRRGKLLQFTNEGTSRPQVLPVNVAVATPDSDPFPPAA